MKPGGGALGRLSLPKGLHLHRREEDPAAPQHLAPADKLPQTQNPAHVRSLNRSVSEDQANSKRKCVDRKDEDGHLVTAIHHTSRNRELLALEWKGSDHIRRRSPFK